MTTIAGDYIQEGTDRCCQKSVVSIWLKQRNFVSDYSSYIRLDLTYLHTSVLDKIAGKVRELDK